MRRLVVASTQMQEFERLVEATRAEIREVIRALERHTVETAKAAGGSP